MFLVTDANDPKRLAQIFIENLLKSSFRGKFYLEGYEIFQKKMTEDDKTGSKRKRSDCASDLLDVESVNKSDDDESGEKDSESDDDKDNNDEDEYCYMNESIEDFNRYRIGTIIVENEFFLTKYE